MKQAFLIFILFYLLCQPFLVRSQGDNPQNKGTKDILNEPPQSDHKVFSIYFGGGSFYIDDLQIEGLDTFISTVDQLENYEVIVSGHTDNIGGKEYNEWLSEMRSQAVKRVLLDKNVPPDIIHLRKFGQDNPLYSNKNHQGRSANRRVDVILIPIIF